MRVHLIGAGFSLAFGYPLGRDLWASLRDTMDSRSKGALPKTQADVIAEAVVSAARGVAAARPGSRALDSAWAGIRHWASAPEAGPLRDCLDGQVDIELLLTKLYVAEMGADPSLVSSDFDARVFRPGQPAGEWSAQVNWARTVIQRALNMYFLWKATEATTARHIAKAWMGQVLRDGDVLITCNYDLLLEQLLWDAGRWSPRDGYGLDFRIVQLLPGYEKAQLASPSLNRLLKLHGSAGWFENTRTGRAFAGAELVSFFVFGRDNGGLPNEFEFEDAQLLEPGYIKHPSLRPHLEPLWTSAGQALREADQVFVVGYSLPPPDRSMAAFLTTALAQRDDVRLTIVDPSAATAGRYEALFGDKVRATHKDFNQWVDAGCPDE
jgi:hypothetical protein